MNEREERIRKLVAWLRAGENEVAGDIEALLLESRTPGPETAKLVVRLGEYRKAPDFAGCISVTLWMTGPEAAAFLREQGIRPEACSTGNDHPVLRGGTRSSFLPVSNSKAS